MCARIKKNSILQQENGCAMFIGMTTIDPLTLNLLLSTLQMKFKMNQHPSEHHPRDALHD
jgi:hypothetical protein